MSLSTEHMITPTSGCRSRMMRSASSPPMPGICTSSSTRSNAVVRIRCRASSPEEAIDDFIPPFSRMKWMFWRRFASSSTIRMLAAREDISWRLYHPRPPPRRFHRAHQQKRADHSHPGQRLEPRRLEPEQEMEARQPTGQVHQPVEALPAAETEAPLPALRGRDGERQQQEPRPHPEKDELVLEDVLGDGVNVEPLIDHRVGEQMQASVEEAEVAEELADPDRPVPTEQDLRRGTGEREREQHERDVPEVVEERLDGVGPQARGDELDGEPERGHAARGERCGDQRLLQHNFLTSTPAHRQPP